MGLPEPLTPELTDEQLTLLRRGIRILAMNELGDLDTAEEVAQETLARVVKAMREGRIREVDKLGAFARGVARHVVLDIIRMRRREVPFDPDSLASHASNIEDPLATLVSQEQVNSVFAALETLASSDREILRLSFFEGMSSEELSMRLREPAARIRKRKERALERLRRAFGAVPRHTPGIRSTQVGETDSAISKREQRAE